ncbi:MAG: proline dehydrogenase family protein, partial [Acidimicrobiales bacterium]
MAEATDPSLDELVAGARERARRLIIVAERHRTRHERGVRRQFVGLFRDPRALGVTIAITDEVMRCASREGASRLLRRTAPRATVAGFGVVNVLGLRLMAAASRVAPALVVRVVHWRVRRLSGDLILEAAPAAFSRHARHRREQGLALNVNVLGEAVLGEREAAQRLARVVAMIRREDVSYVSVKLSALVSQIVAIDHAGSRERVCQRLRTLYREADAHGTFVNLDMEEYRDLRLTVDAFMTVLSEPEFAATYAGIVLQAYLPDSHAALEELIGWAARRREAGAAPIKVRLVKGANLAMEHAEAELHGWVAAPYDTKADVDASYARLLDRALRAEHAGALRVGVASHNLFAVSWALDVAAARGVGEQLDVEMLEGMAPAEARALVREGRAVLLYAPVTRADDFAAAVAYLVRRLDENTAPENYLRAAFAIGQDPTVFDEQSRRFAESVAARHALATDRRRRARALSAGFANAPDGDPTDPAYVAALASSCHEVATRGAPAQLVTLGEDVVGAPPSALEVGTDPNDAGAPWYRYRVADRERVDEVVARARRAAPAWAARPASERAEILARVAAVMEARRATTIAVMARDTGKTLAEGDPEVSEAIDFARYYATLGEDLEKVDLEKVDREGSVPLGVVLVVPPWNFPYSIPAGGVTAALAAGNAVLLKPAPEAVAVGWELAQHLWEGGVPRDVAQFVPTRDDENGRYLVTHDGVDAVVLTGSFDTARLFTSWKPSITLLAETSGKNALVVTASADVDLAVKDLVHSAFANAGQKCSAASLAIVDRATYDNPLFVRQLVDAVTSLTVGGALEWASEVGPVIRPPETALRRALTELDPGESWLVEPAPLDEAGHLWRPGVKVGVAPGSWSHRNEWFGPVLGVMVAPDLATAIEWQNAVDYGLTAGIHSLDEAECATWLERVEAGNLYVNRAITGAVVRRQPFGGWKRSSVGPGAKAGGVNYVAALRRWPEVGDLTAARDDLRRWWDERASRAIDESGLAVERNHVRYRCAGQPILVRVDERFDAPRASYVRTIGSITGAAIELSAAHALDGIDGVIVESLDELVARATTVARVRWWSEETPPVTELLDQGRTTDRRPLSGVGAVEGPRWLLEQSVAITNHRYGNVHAGPKPAVAGLG